MDFQDLIEQFARCELELDDLFDEVEEEEEDDDLPAGSLAPLEDPEQVQESEFPHPRYL